MIQENVVTPVAPILTRWIAHQRALQSVIKDYNQFLAALITSYNNCKASEALCLIMLITRSQVTVTVLMSIDVFEYTALLNLI